MSTTDSNLGLQIAGSVHYLLATEAYVVMCHMTTDMYVLYKMNLRVTTSKKIYGALILLGTYFKSNISIIFLCNTVNNVLF